MIIHPISNECSTEVDGTPVSFNFTYDATEQQYGCLDVNGDFIPFSSGGGIDTSDATAYAKNIESGYTAYCRGEKITGTANVAHGIAKYNRTLGISTSYYNLPNGANVGNYLLFAGGTIMYHKTDSYGWNGTTYVSGFNNELVRATAPSMTYPRHYTAPLSVGNHIVIVSGIYEERYWSSSWESYQYRTVYSNIVESYDENLTKTTLENATISGQAEAHASNSDYAIFGSGSAACAYDSQLVQTTCTNFSNTSDCACVNTENYAICAGARNLSAINTSLTMSQYSLSESRTCPGGAKTSNYIIIAGGQTSNYSQTTSANIDAFNSSFTRTTKSNALTVSRYMITGASTEKYAIFAGGFTNSSPYYKAVADVIDNSLTSSTTSQLDKGKAGMGSGTIGDYVLFAAGRYGTGNYDWDNVVNVYYTY